MTNLRDFLLSVRIIQSRLNKVGTCRACARRLTKRTPSSLESEQEDIRRNTRAADNQGFVSTEEKKRENKTTKGEQGGGDDDELCVLFSFGLNYYCLSCVPYTITISISFHSVTFFFRTTIQYHHSTLFQFFCSINCAQPYCREHHGKEIKSQP